MKTGRFPGRIVAGALILGIVALAIGTVVSLRLSVYRIATGSMEPEFPVGSLVIDSGTAGLEVGRAITFVADGAVVTHVLAGYDDDGSLTTRGTANDSDDRWRTPVYPGDVRGRVLFGIPLTAPSFWGTTQGIVTALAVGTAAFAVVLWRYACRVEREVSVPVRRA